MKSARNEPCRSAEVDLVLGFGLDWNAFPRVDDRPLAIGEALNGAVGTGTITVLAPKRLIRHCRSLVTLRSRLNEGLWRLVAFRTRNHSSTSNAVRHRASST